MNKRKFFGTIMGLIFWSVCIMFFTYAYYNWMSDPTNVALSIEDLSVECLVGDNINVTNIGPVLNYEDGVKAEFSINNMMSDNMAIEIRLDITSISDNLLTESLKYALVSKNVDRNTYDYSNPIIEGDFSKFKVGNNTITKDLEVISEIISNYQFIIYIDGNMYNDPNMQENSLTANLMIGNCGENAVSMDELVYQAIYSETDKSLTFIYNKKLKEGDTYNNNQVTKVYTGFETANYSSGTQVPWRSIRENIEKVSFEEIIKPQSTAFWFRGFNNLTSINLEKLDTSKVTTMRSMFYGCSSLLELDLSNFDTQNVTDMYIMFQGCHNIITLDLSNFNTSKVVNMNCMFDHCYNLTSLDVSSFDTSNVINMEGMFSECTSLLELDLSKFDTNNVTNVGAMFYYCYNLTTTITISNRNISNYGSMFTRAATAKDASGNYIGHIIINYIPDDSGTTDINESTESLVDDMIATKSENSNVVKGSCIGDNCPATT